MDDEQGVTVRLQSRHRAAIENLASQVGCEPWQVATAMLEARLGEMLGTWPGLDRAGASGQRAAERAVARLAERGRPIR